MSYVDGYLLPIPKRHLKNYVRMAAKAGRIWKEHGAAQYRECVGDDMKVKGLVPFPRASRARKGETVVFSWIVYKSKAHRNRVNAKVMKDPRMDKIVEDAGKMPFDMKRMAYGGFKVVVNA